MSAIVLSAQQGEAVSWLLERLCDSQPLIALRGLAGTGKTTLIPSLRSLCEDMGIPVTVASPTHRAAMVLRRKGIDDAQTVHSAALTSYFTPDYAHAAKWLGEIVPIKAGCEPPMPDVEGVPWLVHEKLQGQAVKATTVQRRARQYKAKKALGSIGINGKDHFAGFGPKMGEGCLVIDEASMVGRDMLELCLKAFPMVCLVGDPGQLPPVRDGSCLAEVEGYDLSEIHRQAADSPIIRLAYAAREGQAFWERLPLVQGQIDEWRSVEPQAFLESPLLVWRNTTRLECTKLIRRGLGHPEGEVQVGEPLVCRSTDPADRAEGLYNNALFRIVAVSKHDPRLVTVQEDCGEGTHELLIHMEELHGTNIDPEAVPFRYGYALTCHTAQGGEWPQVYISKPDLYAYAGFCRQKESNELQRWSYTAITRAKQTLGFMAKHEFTRSAAIAVPVWVQGETMPRMTPPSAPMLTVDDPTPSAVMGNGLPHIDDIPDPVVPAGTVETPAPVPAPTATATATATPSTLPPLPDNLLPLAHGFCQHLQAQVHTFLGDEHRALMKSVDASLAAVRTWTEGVMQGNEHAQYSLGDALAKLQEHGANLVHAKAEPYTAVIEARTPAGYALRLTIEKASPSELIEELTRLEGWLVSQGYGVAIPAAAA